MIEDLEPHHAELMIPQWIVDRKVELQARKFEKEHHNPVEDILFLTVLTGGLTYAEKFIGYLNDHSIVDRAQKDELRVNSYGNSMEATTLARVSQGVKDEGHILNKHVVILEDIKDKGYTLEAIVAYLEQLGAASIEIIALLSKETMEVVKPKVKTTIGFKIPAEFVVGFGIDWEGEYRLWKGIWKIVKHKDGVMGDSRSIGEKLWEKANVWIDRHLT